MNLEIETQLQRLPETARTVVADACQSGSWMKVRRALSALQALPVEQQGPEVRVHVLASFGIEGIEPGIQLAFRCLPARPQLVFAPLDTIEQQLLDPASQVYRDPGLATLVLWRAEELIPDLLDGSIPGAVEMAERMQSVQAKLEGVAKAFLRNGAGPLFIGTLTLPFVHRYGVLDSQLEVGAARVIAEINTLIFGLCRLDRRIRVLDVHRWAYQEGRASHDLQMEFLARQPFGVGGAISFSFFLARTLRPLLAPRRKVLAVDLDNTLWGGILGEDGLGQLKIGRDFPGNVFLRIQREIAQLKRQGVLLVLLSKNDEADAMNAFSKLPDMHLKWEDFVCRKVNFRPKYENLREAAAELGLGIDSFTFLDDSDFERAQMRQFLPEVMVLNARGDALQMLSSVLNTDAFDTHHLSEEDLKRHREYELRAARTAGDHGTIDEFLASLELRAQLEPVLGGNLERVAQMMGKTNQFNVTTRRHRTEDLERMLRMPGAMGFALRLSDRFGDQGIVGVLLAIPGDGEAVLVVDSFLVSCRALGRGVEQVLWVAMMEKAIESGKKWLRAEYLPTAKNGLVAGLFDQLGMTRKEGVAGSAEYSMELTRCPEYPAWVVVERKET